MNKLIVTLLLLFCIVNVNAQTKKDQAAAIRIVTNWNQIQNHGGIDLFNTLFDDYVWFYGKHITRESAYKKTKWYLENNSYQEIITPVTVRFYTSGIVECSFTKRTNFKKKIREYPSYLLLKKKDGNYVITAESDLVSDRVTNNKVDLGEEITVGKEVTESSNISTIVIWILVILLVIVSIYFFVEKTSNSKSAKENFKMPEQEHEHAKGEAFEKYIVSRFNKEYFTILEWRSDKEHEGKYAMSSMLPDLEYEFRTKRHYLKFAVECKWRKGFYIDSIEWCKDYQLKNYKDYHYNKGIFVFVIIGVGGTPNDPKDLFIIPLDKLYKTTLYQNEIERYRRYKRSDFFLNADTMVLE